MTVKELRVKTGLSQSRFATQLDIPVRTLQNWEEGVQTPPLYVVSMMQKILEGERHGRWVNIRVSGDKTYATCSECKIEHRVETYMSTILYKFCPECGSIMDLKEEG